MRHNLNNPRCPICKGLTHKMGILVLRYSGRKQKYRCVECGVSFSRPIEQK